MGILERLGPFVMSAPVALTLACIVLGFVAPGLCGGPGATGPLLLLGIHARCQRKHDLLRSYRVLGRMRFLLESAGPVLQGSWGEASAKSFADG